MDGNTVQPSKQNRNLALSLYPGIVNTLAHKDYMAV